MGTSASINPALANLFQNLSSIDSPLLSSSKTVAALEQASPSDIVQLSAAATQLESLNAILGDSETQQTPALSAGDSILSALYGTPATGSSDAAYGSPANALATYQQTEQSQETQTLFG